jgi:DNA mismatch repair protein MutS
MYQVGDFYEFFDADAHAASQALHIALTSRAYGPDEQVPLAGIPVHALETYAGRLVAQGFKVAICEQVEPPGKGLVRRAVTRVLTPGTLVEPGLLPAARDNYLVALAFGRGHQSGQVGLAFVEASTGAFACTAWPAATGPDAVHGELLRLRPAEALVGDQRTTSAFEAQSSVVLSDLVGTVTRCPAHYFDSGSSYLRLCRHFETANLGAFGCENLPLAYAAAGAILAYLERMQPTLLRLISGLTTYHSSDFVHVDARTWNALEIVEPSRSSTSKATLLSTVDATRTAMGARLLRRTLMQPLTDLQMLESRLDAVAALHNDSGLRQHLASLLDGMPDLERLAARVSQGTAQPRDLFILAAALSRLQSARANLANCLTEPLLSATVMLDPCAEFVLLIESALTTPDSADGRMIRSGHNRDLDTIVDSIAASRRWIADLERVERERTGIKSLHVTYNKVFGYAIDVTRANLGRVPGNYERRQTLASGERYVTTELREHEARVFEGEERIGALERQLYQSLLERLGGFYKRMRATAAALAQLDVWLALAEAALVHGYVRPQLTHAHELHIQAGRHPVVEATLDGGTFMPNDTQLGDTRAPGTEDSAPADILLLTGPNMAGKSTYLRQVAQIVVLAQVGSFVPADAASIGLVDRIFARVGADDDLARGVSTFMREMTETAYILRHATAQSLIVLDEVGRGTSTHDGLAIAQAVIEYLHDAVRARTLFATHFHELAEVAEELPNVHVAAMQVHEQAGQIVFLHRLAPGKATRSYGVQVARMAGLPHKVTARATQLLATADNSHTNTDQAPDRASRSAMRESHPSSKVIRDSGGCLEYIVPAVPALSESARDLIMGVVSLNVAGMTPIEAINVLYRLRERATTLLQSRND